MKLSTVEAGRRAGIMSTFHDKLQDVETGLYLEGAEYLYGILNEELTGRVMG